jgi:hypothetical protein
MGVGVSDGASPVAVGEHARRSLEDIGGYILDLVRAAAGSDAQEHVLHQILDLVLVSGLAAEIQDQCGAIRLAHQGSRPGAVRHPGSQSSAHNATTDPGGPIDIRG